MQNFWSHFDINVLDAEEGIQGDLNMQENCKVNQMVSGETIISFTHLGWMVF